MSEVETTIGSVPSGSRILPEDSPSGGTPFIALSRSETLSINHPMPKRPNVHR